MISRQEVTKRATHYQTSEMNIVREYGQHLFLSNLYRQPLSDRLLFKGSTALRLLYRSARFSEDLDFTGCDITSAQIEAVLEATLIELEKTGLEVALSEAKPTSGGYLATAHLGVSEWKIDILIQISLRTGTIMPGELTTAENEYLPSYTVVALPKNILIKEKIQALLTRGKPRDFYDLYFILRANLLPPSERHILRQAADKIAALKSFKKQDIEPLLPASFRPLLKNFPKILAAEIQRFL